MKSLKDTLLQLCVQNFAFTFLENDQDGHGLTLKKNVDLSDNNLFESTLLKVREMGFYISPVFMKICLKFRKALNWQNVDLYYLKTCKSGSLGSEDIKTIVMSGFPIKKLTFTTGFVTESMMIDLSKLAATLEHLEIGYNDATFYPYCGVNVYEYEFQSKIKMPKLQHLKLESNVVPTKIINMIDLNSLSETLLTLQLKAYHFQKDDRSIRLIDFIRSCKKLNALSLEGSRWESEETFFDCVKSLKELRSLNLYDVDKFASGNNLNLSHLISCFPKLTDLELSYCKFSLTNFNCLKYTSFNYLGIVNLKHKNVVELRAKSMAHEKSFDGLLTFLEKAENDIQFTTSVCKFERFLIHWDVNNEQFFRYEQALVRSIEKFYHNYYVLNSANVFVKHPSCINRQSSDLMEFIERRLFILKHLWQH